MLKVLPLAIVVAGILAALACFSPPEGPPPPDGKPPQEERPAEKDRLPPGEPAIARVITVGPARAECYGPFRRMCLIVDGRYFYDEIDDFTHEPGHTYRLRIERYDAFPGQKEPPQDAGRYGYRLLEVIVKTPVSGSAMESTIAPTRVNCPRSDETCLLVDGKPFRGSITGFHYEPGYDYVIRFESFDDGTHRLIEEVSKDPAQGVEVELEVGPWRVECYENAPITAACIVVDGEPFYGRIEDFPRAHGYEYRLRAVRYDLMPEVAIPPTETSKYGYRVLEILSKMPASQPPAN